MPMYLWATRFESHPELSAVGSYCPFIYLIVNLITSHVTAPWYIEFLSRFGALIDVRYQDGKLIDYWSTTAEQAMLLGLDVIDWLNVRHTEGLDDIYKSENGLEQIRPVYESITR